MDDNRGASTHKRLLWAAAFLAGALAGTPLQGDGKQAPVDEKNRRIGELVAAYHQIGRFDGVVLVVDRGATVYEGAFGLANREWDIPNDPTTKFRIGSTGKLFTALLTLQLVEEERLSLADPVSKHLPQYREDTGSKVTIHHLLSHSSGIPDYFDRDFLELHMYRQFERDEFIATFCSGDLEFEPGTDGRYSNPNYHLLGAIIEEITGESFEDVLRARILDPLGMKDTGLSRLAKIEPRAASGYIRSLSGYRHGPSDNEDLQIAVGGMYSTLADLRRFDRALYGNELLSAPFRAKLYQGHAPSSFGRDLEFGYGALVGQRELGGPDERSLFVHEAGGNTTRGFTAIVSRLTEDERLVVLMSNSGPGWFDPTFHQINGQIIDILYGAPYEPPKQPLEAVIFRTLSEKGIEPALAQYRASRDDARYANSQQGLYSLGSELLQMDRIQEAIAIFGLVVEDYPESSWSYNGLGEAHLAAGDRARAKELFVEALERNPNNSQAAGNLARLAAGPGRGSG